LAMKNSSFVSIDYSDIRLDEWAPGK